MESKEQVIQNWHLVCEPGNEVMSLKTIVHCLNAMMIKHFGCTSSNVAQPMFWLHPQAYLQELLIQSIEEILLEVNQLKIMGEIIMKQAPWEWLIPMDVIDVDYLSQLYWPIAMDVLI